MELSPEERRKIYEEEKARIQAEEKAKIDDALDRAIATGGPLPGSKEPDMFVPLILLLVLLGVGAYIWVNKDVKTMKAPSKYKATRPLQ